MKAKKYPRICANCKYFVEWSEDETDWALHDGECRRYPETKYKHKESWCGEFAIMRDPRVCEEDTERE